MTATMPDALATLLARSQAAAPKAKKGATLTLNDPALARYTTPTVDQERVKSEAFAMLSTITAWPLLDGLYKSVEALKDQSAAVIMAAAEPVRVEGARAAHEMKSSVKINGELLYMCSPPNWQTSLHGDTEALTAARVAQVKADFGERFTDAFEPVFEIKGATIEQLAASGLPCTVKWKPRKEFNALRTLDPQFAALCEQSLPDVQPVRYV